MTINQITAIAALIACNMRFGDFPPEQRDSLVARTKSIIDNKCAPEYTADELGTEEASGTFDRVALILARFEEERPVLDALVAKAYELNGGDPATDPIHNAMVAMEFANRLLGEEMALVANVQLDAMIEAALPMAEPGETVFETAIRVLREAAFTQGKSGALVIDGESVVPSVPPVVDGSGVGKKKK